MVHAVHVMIHMRMNGDGVHVLILLFKLVRVANTLTARICLAIPLPRSVGAAFHAKAPRGMPENAIDLTRSRDRVTDPILLILLPVLLNIWKDIVVHVVFLPSLQNATMVFVMACLVVLTPLSMKKKVVIAHIVRCTLATLQRETVLRLRTMSVTDVLPYLIPAILIQSPG